MKHQLPNRLLLAIAVLAAVSTIVIALRVDATTIAFALGILCGAPLYIPATILATTLYLRRQSTPRRDPRDPNQPPVVIISPGAQYQQPPNQYLPSPPPSSPRQFTVLGDDDTP
jgi:hypothetical protein